MECWRAGRGRESGVGGQGGVGKVECWRAGRGRESGMLEGREG